MSVPAKRRKVKGRSPSRRHAVRGSQHERRFVQLPRVSGNSLEERRAVLPRRRTFLLPSVKEYLLYEFRQIVRSIDDPIYMRDVVGQAIQQESFKIYGGAVHKDEDAIVYLPPTVLGRIIVNNAHDRLTQFKAKFPRLSREVDIFLENGLIESGKRREMTDERFRRLYEYTFSKIFNRTQELVLNDPDYEEWLMRELDGEPIMVKIDGEERPIWSFHDKGFLAWGTEGNFWEGKKDIISEGQWGVSNALSKPGPVIFTPAGYPDLNGAPIYIFIPKDAEAFARKIVKRE